MTEPESQPTQDERLARVEGELKDLQGEVKNLADVVLTFTTKVAEIAGRRVTTSSLPPELQVRPGAASARPTPRLVREPRRRGEGRKRRDMGIDSGESGSSSHGI